MNHLVGSIAPSQGTVRRRCYGEYHDTGRSLLKSIPSHWTTRRLKHLLTRPLQYGANESGDPETVGQPRYIRITDIQEDGGLRDDTIRSLAEEIARPYLLQQGDLLLARSGATVGKSFLYRPSWGRAAYAGYLIRARLNPAKVLPDFAYYFTLSNPYWQTINSVFIQATIQNISAEKYGNIVLPIPPLEEQRAIAAFLDRETAKIDELIAKKQRLDELLTEKIRSLQSLTVTGSAGVHSRETTTDIPWLPSCPHGWQLLPLRRVVKWIEQGWSPSCDAREAEPGEWGVLKAGCVNSGELDESENKKLPDDISPELSYQIRPGNVLMSRACGTVSLVGSVAFVKQCREKLLLCDKVFRLHPNTARISPEFLAEALKSKASRTQIEQSLSGADGLANNITQSTIKGIVIAVPSLAEQRRICSAVAEMRKQIHGLRIKTQAAVTGLKEYRSALISAAVTGQIDVREADPVAPTVARRANKHFHRCVLAAEIIDRHLDTRRFGRIKLQKLLILAEGHLRLTEIQSEPLRAAAGPFDNRMMRSLHVQLARQKWYAATKTDHGTIYSALEKSGEHRKYFDRYWADRCEDFDALIALFKDATTEQVEIVATLYSAWNDFLLERVEFDDSRLVNEVFTNWDPGKQRIEPERWLKAIEWMREKGIVPTGFGSHTRGGQSDDE